MNTLRNLLERIFSCFLKIKAGFVWFNIYRQEIGTWLHESPRNRLSMIMSLALLLELMAVFYGIAFYDNMLHPAGIFVICFGGLMVLLLMYVMVIHCRSPQRIIFHPEGFSPARGRRGVSVERRKSFTRIVLEKDAKIAKDILNENCSICLCEMSEKEEIMILPCNHPYHANCVDSWILGHHHCPLCKLDLNVSNDEELGGSDLVEDREPPPDSTATRPSQSFGHQEAAGYVEGDVESSGEFYIPEQSEYERSSFSGRPSLTTSQQNIEEDVESSSPSPVRGYAAVFPIFPISYQHSHEEVSQDVVQQR
mmetsp:Transcript_18110/g.23829  ORF Transcript_18110/g.23829 Transcript_18110/m.23829 type:complete len:309 (+) Transcript_18110:139-1065(+)